MSNTIKIYRAKRGLTQEEFAKQLGVTRQTIISIENERYMPSLGLAFKIARFFDTRIEEVFNY